ncbi:MAG TPA: ATP-binding protein [Anaerolineales bacterium]
MKAVGEFLDRILTIQARDPDDARRRRLLNVLMLGMFVSGLVGALVVIGDAFTLKSLGGAGSQLLLPTAAVIMVGIAILYYINRHSGRWAAFLFLLLLTAAFSFSDTPDQLANGRSLFVYTFPIVISSLILFPSASFIFAAIGSGIIIWLANSASIVPNVPAIIGFFMLALVSWLSARGLEQALKDQRTVNANLDRLVAERTQALAESLTRERIEAGRSEAILNSIADGVIVFDNNRRAILANPALVNLMDIPFGGITGKRLDELLNNEQITINGQERFQALLENPGPIGESLRLEWGKKTLSVNAAQVFDTAGENIGTVAVFRDFTREAEVERMKSTFVAVVSHELRTPLNAILGYAEMLKEAVFGSINEKQSLATDRIMSNTQHLLGIVSELLDQAQIEAGKLKIRVEPFKPAELLENVHGVMDKITADKNLKLNSRIDPELPESLLGDSHRLQQVLINLVNNSVKFTTDGEIQIYLFRNNQTHWGMEVRDTGAGIPEEEIPYIFDTFRQVDSTTTRQHGGIGLGLAIVKQLVDLMQGKISVKSRQGNGSSFTIIFPFDAEETVHE